MYYLNEREMNQTHTRHDTYYHSLTRHHQWLRQMHSWVGRCRGCGSKRRREAGQRAHDHVQMYANISSYLFINIQLWRQSLFNQCFYLDWRNALFYPKMWKFAIFDEIRTENRTIFAKKSEFQTFAEKSDHSGGTERTYLT